MTLTAYGDHAGEALEAAKSELAVLKEKSTLSASSAQQAEKRNQTYQTLLSEKNAQVATGKARHA